MKITIHIGGMSCEHCASRVKKAISQIEGVKSANVDLESKCATVEVEDGSLVTRIKEAIKEAGYRVE